MWRYDLIFFSFKLFIYFSLRLRIFYTPHFPHSAFSTLRIFYTPHFPHSAFSSLCIFHTPHFPHSAFSTLLIFHTPHSALHTLRFPLNRVSEFFYLAWFIFCTQLNFEARRNTSPLSFTDHNFWMKAKIKIRRHGFGVKLWQHWRQIWAKMVENSLNANLKCAPNFLKN